VFLERPRDPVTATYTDREALELELSELAAGVVTGAFPVAAEPCVAICNGCPGEGGLCSWPVEMTRREVATPDASGPGPHADADAPRPPAPPEPTAPEPTAPEPSAPEPTAPEASGPEAATSAPPTAEAQGRLF
jgi:hypothetical protein